MNVPRSSRSFPTLPSIAKSNLISRFWRRRSTSSRTPSRQSPGRRTPTRAGSHGPLEEMICRLRTSKVTLPDCASSAAGSETSMQSGRQPRTGEEPCHATSSRTRHVAATPALRCGRSSMVTAWLLLLSSQLWKLRRWERGSHLDRFRGGMPRLPRARHSSSPPASSCRSRCPELTQSRTVPRSATGPPWPAAAPAATSSSSPMPSRLWRLWLMLLVLFESLPSLSCWPSGTEVRLGAETFAGT
mmetsp:Transcript_23094/g.66623  ORF Transcript_23094/g.66623 Transcript_23094/m.66623 type:complete len:244 (-) Transcript_23094:1809-2540(-)